MVRAHLNDANSERGSEKKRKVTQEAPESATSTATELSITLTICATTSSRFCCKNKSEWTPPSFSKRPEGVSCRTWWEQTKICNVTSTPHLPRTGERRPKDPFSHAFTQRTVRTIPFVKAFQNSIGMIELWRAAWKATLAERRNTSAITFVARIPRPFTRS